MQAARPGAFPNFRRARAVGIGVHHEPQSSDEQFCRFARWARRIDFTTEKLVAVLTLC